MTGDEIDGLNKLLGAALRFRSSQCTCIKPHPLNPNGLGCSRDMAWDALLKAAAPSDVPEAPTMTVERVMAALHKAPLDMPILVRGPGKELRKVRKIAEEIHPPHGYFIITID